MGTLTGFGFTAIFVLAVLNWYEQQVGSPPQAHGLEVFSAGFILGMFGMYLAAWLYGYRKSEQR